MKGYHCQILTLLFFINSVAIAQQEKKWYIPDHGKLHFAGGTGFLSAGAGYELFPAQNGEIDLFVGYLPASIGGEHIYTATVKFHYMPFKTALFTSGWQIEPLTLGGMLYQSYGHELNRARDPDLYPEDYYWWSIKTRFGPFIGSRVTKELGSSFIRSVTFYGEIGTNDLYIYSWATNRSTVPFSKLWNSSFGLKVRFGK